MPTLFLHAGTSKAGSTAIQELAAANCFALSQQGIAYFPVLQGPNHAELAAAFCARPTRVAAALGVADERSRSRLRSLLQRRLETSLGQASTWLATSEHLSSLLKTKAEISACADFLHGFFDEITVILVIRRADHWLPSAYCQSIRSGETRPFDGKYVQRRRRLLDHQALAARWQRAFGSAAVACVPYLESDKRSFHALADRTLLAFGIAETIAWIKPSSQPSNPAISAVATEVLRTANPILRTGAIRVTSSRARAVSYIAQRWPGPPPSLTPEALLAHGELGLSLTALADTKFAVGSDWQAWCDQPIAPNAPQPALSPAERETALSELRRRRLVTRRPGGGQRSGSLTEELFAPVRRIYRSRPPRYG